MEFNPKLPQVVRDLLKAEEILDREGLAKNTRIDPWGRVCAHGALALAITGDVNGLLWGNSRHEAATILALLLVDTDSGGLGPWNDRPERTKVEVIQLFDDAASLALSEAAIK